MANTIYISGKGFWLHRLFEFDEFRGTRSWNMKIYPDPKSMRIIEAAKLQQKQKKDDEGISISLKRRVDKPWALKKGEAKEFAPPVVTDKDGRPWPTDKMLGNGSEVTAKVEVYTTKGGLVGARLEAVRVDAWVEYVPPVDADYDNDEEVGNDSAAPF